MIHSDSFELKRMKNEEKIRQNSSKTLPQDRPQKTETYLGRVLEEFWKKEKEKF